jgi:hypothetical protein
MLGRRLNLAPQISRTANLYTRIAPELMHAAAKMDSLVETG